MRGTVHKPPVLSTARAQTADGTGMQDRVEPEAEQGARPARVLGHPEDIPESWPRPRRFSPLTGLAAWAVPGLGHWMLGRPRRAVRIAGGTLGLILLGVLIGGIGLGATGDGRWWLGARGLAGPVMGVLQFVSESITPGLDRSEGVRVGPVGPSAFHPIGRASELGKLALSLAGLVNLVAVLDAAFPLSERRRSGGGS